MIDKATDILKWIVTLTPEKAVIAILLVLVIYFGWNNFNTTITNNVLQTERNQSSLECTTQIVKANIECQDKMSEQTKEYQLRYDTYRDRVETDNLARINVWKAKYDVVEKKLEEAQANQKRTDELIQKITNKLK
jgi:predicted negative regulator of RcsB-dependent stress response